MPVLLIVVPSEAKATESGTDPPGHLLQDRNKSMFC